MNVVALVGNLCADVEMRAAKSGDPIARFRLAVQRPTREKEVDFFSCTAFGKQAVACGEFLTKGCKVSVEGRLNIEKWEKDDVKRESVSIIANRVNFISTSRSSDNPAPVAVGAVSDDDDDFPF